MKTKVMMVAIEAGAEDVIPEGDVSRSGCDVADFMAAREGLEKAGLKVHLCRDHHDPKNTVALDESDARKTFRLLDALEDNDGRPRGVRQLSTSPTT